MMNRKKMKIDGWKKRKKELMETKEDHCGNDGRMIKHLSEKKI